MHRRPRLPSANPRALLTPAALQILLALAEGDRHGHAIRQDIEARTDLRLGPGTLYEALHRMRRAGWVAHRGLERSTAGGARKYYALTAEGRRVMSDELQRLDRIVRDARDRALLPARRKA